MSEARIASAAAASLAVAQAALHLLFVGSLPALQAGAMVVLALACALCGAEVWRRPQPRAWAMMLVLGAAMIAVHTLAGHDVAMAHDPSAAGMAHHGHAMHGGGAAASPASLAMTAALWLAVAETVLAAAMLVRGAGRRRRMTSRCVDVW